MQTVDAIRCICILLACGLDSCWSCNDGFFRDESKTCVKCPVNCQFCESNEYCLSCKNGYWGNACEQSCSACKADTSCDKTNGVCVESCKDGYTGVLCDSRCIERCSSCNRTNAQICLGCAHGRYPPVACNKSCPVSCSNSSCDALDLCTNGCYNGFYGQLCELRCSENCRENLCYQDNGTCVHGCEGKFTRTQCDTPQNTGNSATVVVVPVFVSVLVVVVVIAVLFVVRRKRRRASEIQKQEEAQEMLPSDVGRSIESTNHGSAKIREKTEDSSQTQATARNIVLRTFCFCFTEQRPEQTKSKVEINSSSLETNFSSQTEQSAPPKKTKETKLQDLVDKIKDKTDKDLENEFKKLPVTVQKSHKISLQKENSTNMEKEGVFPYDENIVTVHENKGKKLYVNASFIEDKGGNTYIASTGPRKKDGPRRMWRLIWENNCQTVVMLNTFEKEKKEIYWPRNKEKKKYDKMSVRPGDIHQSTLEKEQCIIRVFELKEGKTTKFVKQLQYTGWPEKAVPDIHKLLAFITMVRDAHLEGSGPIVVHGRRGVGRTGTFIALDMLLKEVDDLLNCDEDKTIDVFHCVENLRQQRTLMVEDIKQYKFLHEALQQYAEKLLQKYKNARNENTETPNEKGERNTETPKEKDERNTKTPNVKNERNIETQKMKDERKTETSKKKDERNAKTRNENKDTTQEKDKRNTKIQNENRDTTQNRDERDSKTQDENKETPKDQDERNTKTLNENKETPKEKDDRNAKTRNENRNTLTEKDERNTKTINEQFNAQTPKEKDEKKHVDNK